MQRFKNKRVHLIGISGVSMASLAETLRDKYGAVVTGSDWSIDGHRAENVHGADYVIRTAAAGKDNPEVAEARRRGIPLMERAEVWGLIMREYGNTICVAGTHGKSTTTAMLAQIFMEAGRDPSVMVGATFPLIGGNHRMGKSGDFIAEADEYSNSFRFFKPNIALILNMEYDHPDCYPTFEDYKAAFDAFAASANDVIREYDTAIIEGITLKVPGEHNRLNAAAAAAVAERCGIGGAAIKTALEKFTGVKRRFEYKGELNGAAFYDDYAHHPGELTATLTMAKTLPYKRVIAAFQPHTYTRTRALLPEFAEALKIADKAVLMEIYAAREDNVYGVSSSDVAKLVSGAEFYVSLEDVKRRLREIAEPGDLVMTIGAGDITNVWEL
jgi:UDP-N-acetylmuramate--alanine ligase